MTIALVLKGIRPYIELQVPLQVPLQSECSDWFPIAFFELEDVLISSVLIKRNCCATQTTHPQLGHLLAQVFQKEALNAVTSKRAFAFLLPFSLT